MRALLFLSVICFCPYLQSADIDSYEVNHLEFTPIYDIILFNDIADVIKDFENGLNPQSETLMESESNENIEDLLLEYQNYLEKAHKQRVDYVEKVSGKNKVPLLRHEKYPKKKPVSKINYGEIYKSFSNNIPESAKLFSNPSLFLPNYMSNSQFSYLTSRPNLKKYSPREDEYGRSNQILGMSYKLQKPISSKTAMSSCYCKVDEIPCNCGCKQCIVAIPDKFDTNQKDAFSSPIPYIDSNFKPLWKRESNMNANDFKIRIKVDIKLPKILELLLKLYENKSLDTNMLQSNKISSKDASANFISSYLRPPNPMELLKYSAFSGLSNSIPMQSITIHKKKKARTNSNKKHRKKSLNIHVINEDKNLTTNVLSKDKNITNSIISTKINYANDTNIKSTNLNNTTIKTSLPKMENNQSHEFIYLTFNISNSNENHTDVTRLENSIETGETKAKDKLTTSEINMREKRQIKLSNDSTHIPMAKRISNNNNQTHDKKLENILEDPNLLHWSENNIPLPNNSSKNVNNLIVNIEKRKTKFTMSTENMRNNHSIALEKAIFGEIDWNDIDTVAPVFMSFVGKYVRGILTFCTNIVCHSMKCAGKTCIHRKCEPNNRYNKKGHCLGTNSTDSIAKLESIMDLPSNVAFEIVDILKGKMNANMFGKMTICIGFKCITFVASKKIVFQSKCTSKELTPTKECPLKKY